MFSERLKASRKEARLTQEELAKKLNTTKGTISNYENNHSTPSNEGLSELADVLNVSTDYLLGRTTIKYQFDENKTYENKEEFLDDPILKEFLDKRFKDASPEKIAETIKKLDLMFELINGQSNE